LPTRNYHVQSSEYHVPMNSPASIELAKLVHASEQRLLDTVLHLEGRIAIMNLVREIDLFYLWQNSSARANGDFNEEAEAFLEYGCNKALRMFVDETSQHELVPLFPASNETQAWAKAVLYHCGQIAVCERLLDCERAGLGTFVNKDDIIHFQFASRNIGLENVERDEFDWMQNFVAGQLQPVMNSLIESSPEIERNMEPLVRVWRNHYIAYSTTQEIASHYEKLGTAIAKLMLGNDIFPGEVRFGGLDFSHYRAAVATLAGWMRKHLDFAKILKRRYPRLEYSNLVTVHQETKILAGYLAGALEIELQVAEQCLSALTLTNENKDFVCMHRGAPPPLIQLGKAHVLESVAGCLNAPFQFMATALRHSYPEDWDRGVQLREKVFRAELFNLFPQNWIVRVPHAVTIRQGNKDTTDIDAAIFDLRNGVAGLFQLKWQDVFGPSIRARDSRKRNFLPSTQGWLEKTLEFLSASSPRVLADSFGLKLEDTERLNCFRVFVLGRNFAHFSGDDSPDARAAWGLWPQVLRVAAEQYNDCNPIDGLFYALKSSSPLLKPRPEIKATQFKLGERQIIISLAS
jgi:hypothetical protein